MPLDSNPCPADPEEVVEAYTIGTLPKEQAIAFEGHYITCPLCAAILEDTAQYIDAMRAAAKKLRSTGLKGG